jgi:hypothetical protein
MFKFIFRLEWFNEILFSKNYSIKYYLELSKIGLVDTKSFGEFMGYIVPELLIISFIMLNEIKLKLLGLYWKTELEVESVNEGIDRWLCYGDEAEVERKRQEASNMSLHRFFENSKE